MTTSQRSSLFPQGGACHGTGEASDAKYRLVFLDTNMSGDLHDWEQRIAHKRAR